MSFYSSLHQNQEYFSGPRSSRPLSRRTIVQNTKGLVDNNDVSGILSLCLPPFFLRLKWFLSTFSFLEQLSLILDRVTPIWKWANSGLRISVITGHIPMVMEITCAGTTKYGLDPLESLMVPKIIPAEIRELFEDALPFG